MEMLPFTFSGLNKIKEFLKNRVQLEACSQSTNEHAPLGCALGVVVVAENIGDFLGTRGARRGFA